MSDERTHCRYCGASAPADAWYCLECGEGIAPIPEPQASSSGNRRATIGALLAVCLIGGGAAAYGIASRSSDKSAAPGPKTGDNNNPHTPSPSDFTTTSSSEYTGVDTASTASTAGTGTSSTTSDSGKPIPDWKGTGYTVVAKSLEKKSHSRAEAVTFARTLSCSVGVLDSSRHPLLNAGYWVVFCGHYSTQAAATAATSGVRTDAPGAYPRHVA